MAARSGTSRSSSAPKQSRKYDRMFCEHCMSFVSKSTWYSHYDLKDDLSKENTTSIFNCDNHASEISSSSDQESSDYFHNIRIH